MTTRSRRALTRSSYPRAERAPNMNRRECDTGRRARTIEERERLDGQLRRGEGPERRASAADARTCWPRRPDERASERRPWASAQTARTFSSLCASRCFGSTWRAAGGGVSFPQGKDSRRWPFICGVGYTFRMLPQRPSKRQSGPLHSATWCSYWIFLQPL